MPYFESRLRLNPRNSRDVEQKLNFCKILGINNLVIEFENGTNKISAALNEICTKYPTLKLYYRTTIKPKNLDELKVGLKQAKSKLGIISVESSNKKIQIQAAKDSRVDLISFSTEETIKTITPGVISLTKQNNSFIEFSLDLVMIKNKAIQSRILRSLYRAFQLALQSKANYIISGNFSDIFNLRHPRALASISHTLLDIPLSKAKQALSENVMALINRSKFRQDKNYVESGVKITKRGDIDS